MAVIKVSKISKENSSLRQCLRLFVFGFVWYCAGLLPFVFINDKMHFNTHYLYIPVLGFGLMLSAILIGSCGLLSKINIWISRLIMCFVLIFFMLSAFFAVDDKTDKNLFNFVYAGRNLKNTLLQIKSLYVNFPEKSSIYLIGGSPEVLRIGPAMAVYYNDPGMKYTYFAEESGAIARGNNTYVLILSGDVYSKKGLVKVADLTPFYKK
ncbi:MAG: hypothetical protein NT033_03665 [Candidatus Omnitrophica bacterium]|nr:hypothetical protein [Candidatus Omnitrophota bacterium]